MRPMTMMQIGNIVIEWWRTGARTEARLVDLSEHYAGQWNVASVDVEQAARKIAQSWEWEG